MNDEQQANPEQNITIIGSSSGKSRTRGKKDIIEKTMAVTQVRENFARFLNSLKAMVEVDIPSAGDFELDEVQFTAEISADGEFKLMGTGVGVEASSGVTFTLKRKEHTSGK